MDSTRLSDVAEEQLDLALAGRAGRSARTLHLGGSTRLRQTVLALEAGRRLGAHTRPGEATLQVLRGIITLHAGGESWTGQEGDLLAIPEGEHDVEAITDAAMLLTAVVDARD